MNKNLKNTIRSLPAEDRRMIRDMRRYFIARFLNPVCRDELMEDIVGMAQESRARGASLAETIGMDCQQFCHELAANTPRQRAWEITWGILAWTFAAYCVTVPLLFLYSVLFPKWTVVRTDGLFASVPIGGTVKYALVIAGLIAAYYLLRRLSYRAIVPGFAIYVGAFMALLLLADSLLEYLLDGAAMHVNLLCIIILLAGVTVLCFAMRYYAALLNLYQIKRLKWRENRKD